jgi:hypothetical protein
MRLRTILALGPGFLSLVACGGSSAPVESAAPEELNASSSHTSEHDAFVCQSDHTAITNGISMFAFDPQGFVDAHHTRAGYCQIALESPGKPIDSYLCEVTETETADTSDGQLALLFTKFLGDGNDLLTQYNLPKDLREKKGGKGTMRTLSRSPHDLTQPIPDDEAEHVTCKLESVKFPVL